MPLTLPPPNCSAMAGSNATRITRPAMDDQRAATKTEMLTATMHVASKIAVPIGPRIANGNHRIAMIGG
jgi:hypothetical protein